MLRHNNVNARAMALLYLRLYANFEDIYGWLSSKFGDDDLINAEMTVGEFARRLLDEDRLNYEGLRLPRLPVRIQRWVKEKLGETVLNADEVRREEIKKR